VLLHSKQHTVMVVPVICMTKNMILNYNIMYTPCFLSI